MAEAVKIPPTTTSKILITTNPKLKKNTLQYAHKSQDIIPTSEEVFREDVDYFFGWSQFLFLIWKRNYGEWVEIRVSREACPRRFEKYAKKYPWDICDFFFNSLHYILYP